MTSPSPFLTLPDELLEAVFSCLPAEDLARVSQASRRTRDVASNKLLWRSLCRDKYSYWHPQHRILERLRAPATDTEWRHVYRERAQQDTRLRSLLEAIISTEHDRMTKMEAIYGYGADAKDILFEYIDCPDSADDVLARRYWASEVLGTIDRIYALNELKKVCADRFYPIERALGLLDLLVVENVAYDLADISARIDSIADAFKKAHPDTSNSSLRAKALDLQRFLRREQLTRVPRDAEFSKIRRRLIGVALFDQDHDAIPLVACGIYCAVATRLGINASINNFPFNVYVTVEPPRSETLDGKPKSADEEMQRMFLNPGGTEDEITVSYLRSILTMMGEPADDLEVHVAPAELVSLMVRMTRNLMPDRNREHEVGFDTVLEMTTENFRASNPPSPLRKRRIEPVMLSPERAVYAASLAHMAMFVSGQPLLPHLFDAYRFFLRSLMIALANNFSLDCWVIERFILPGLAIDEQSSHALRQLVMERRDADKAPKPIKRRRGHNVQVSYRIGHVFEHRRYRYTAVVRGWDPTCQQGEYWIETQMIDTLPNGRHQAFYYSLSDKDYYVAAENVGVVGSSGGPSAGDWRPSGRLLSKAGRYFKRFDAAEGRFISNMRSEYPDD